MTKSRIPLWLALIGSGISGMFVAAQSRINGGLSTELGNGYVAALVSFGSGLVILAIALAVSARGRRGLGRIVTQIRGGEFPWWGVFGGACGGLFVLSQGLVAGVLGVALFTVGVVAGQVLGGLLMDRLGLGPGGRIDPSLTRLIGTGLVLVAVVVSVISDLGHGSGVWMVLLPFVAGILMSWQTAVNGLVRSAAESALTATFINFLVGTVVLFIAAAVSVAAKGMPVAWPTNPLLYLGGAIGIFFIVLNTILVRTAGVLLLSMAGVAGQLVASLLLELGLPLSGGLTAGMALGCGIALVAVVIAAFPGRTRSAV